MTSFKSIDKVCLYCKGYFIAQKVSTKYCSLECAQRAYKQQKRDESIHLSMEEEEYKKEEKRFVNLLHIETKEFLSIKEACELFHINRKTIYRLIKSNKLKAVKIGQQRVIIKKSELNKLFN
ncbi:helix-turn-helix domain-containing protein [Sediminitomix flava]|uniref:Excisionase family DNA binding protein n=1 Tax=Sediminitomix flava TaxID=379075 RepID=A0A315ZY16_SEDFL|nr:helix-turn-helix domain-containing protein [Sediminitomix flava]PWJ42237.1 excisionase family DNA binding protein [Sediminitomix flava]